MIFDIFVLLIERFMRNIVFNFQVLLLKKNRTNIFRKKFKNLENFKCLLTANTNSKHFKNYIISYVI